MNKFKNHFATLWTLFYLISTLLHASARKHSFVTKKDGRFLIGPIGVPYGFLEGGVYNLTVNDFELATGPVGKINKASENQKNIPKEVEGVQAGFLLKRFETEGEYARFADGILEDPSICSFETFINNYGDDDVLTALDDDNFEKDATATGTGVVDGGPEGIFLDMKSVENMWKPNKPVVTHTFTSEEEGYYFLIYQVCLIGDKKKFIFKEIRSTFELDFHYKNYDILGNVSYLTAGEMPLPHMFMYFSVSYLLLLFVWMRNLKQIMNGKNGCFGSGSGRPKVYAIHHLMSLLLFLKTISIFFESIRYHYIRIHGHAEFWSVIYYFFSFLKGTFLFTVILLIGSGWSFVKPILSEKEKKIIFVVLVMQVIDNVALVVLNSETEGERLYDDWSAILHLVDIVCCCTVVVPIVWQVNALELSTEGEAGGESARILSKLKLFRTFYLIVVGYIYFTRIAIYLFASSLGYKHTWLRYLVTELGTMVFYITVGIKFSPVVENPYFEVRKDDYDNQKDMEEGPRNSGLELMSNEAKS